MSDFKILKEREKADSLYGIEHKKITELELEALLDGKRLWTDINWEYAITIQLKNKQRKIELDKEIERLQSIIKEAREYINIDKNCIPKHIKDYINNLLDKVEEK